MRWPLGRALPRCMLRLQERRLAVVCILYILDTPPPVVPPVRGRRILLPVQALEQPVERARASWEVRRIAGRCLSRLGKPQDLRRFADGLLVGEFAAVVHHFSPVVARMAGWGCRSASMVVRSLRLPVPHLLTCRCLLRRRRMQLPPLAPYPVQVMPVAVLMMVLRCRTF